MDSQPLSAAMRKAADVLAEASGRYGLPPGSAWTPEQLVLEAKEVEAEEKDEADIEKLARLVFKTLNSVHWDAAGDHTRAAYRAAAKTVFENGWRTDI